MKTLQRVLSKGIRLGGGKVVLHGSTILKELKFCAERTKKYFKDETYVADSYKVYLSEQDLSDFEPFLKALKQELVEEMMGYIQTKGYRILSGRVDVLFEHRPTYEPGQWKIGYKFRNPASGRNAEARNDIRLKIVSGGAALPPVEIGEGSFVVGRSPAADIEIPAGDLSVSKRHCRLIVENGRLLVRDLGSKNGTFVNGHPVTGLFPVKPGDRMGMGNTEIEIQK